MSKTDTLQIAGPDGMMPVQPLPPWSEMKDIPRFQDATGPTYIADGGGVLTSPAAVIEVLHKVASQGKRFLRLELPVADFDKLAGCCESLAAYGQVPVNPKGYFCTRADYERLERDFAAVSRELATVREQLARASEGNLILGNVAAESGRGIAALPARDDSTWFDERDLLADDE